MRRNRRWIVACCSAALLLCARPQTAPAQRADRASQPQSERDAVSFVVGNVEFLLVHEIAHFLIAEKDVPIIGPEENAADYIATITLIREEPLDPAADKRGIEFLLSAADAFAAAWKAGTTAGAEVPYWGSHSLSIQRYYQVACLLYGSDTKTFRRVPEIAGLPPDRAAGCVAEHARAERSMRWLLDNYGRKAGDPPDAATEVIYESPPTRTSARVLRELQSLQLLERSLERLHTRFTLERPFRLVVRPCGRAQAGWIPESRELVICYELLDALYVLGLRPNP